MSLNDEFISGTHDNASRWYFNMYAMLNDVMCWYRPTRPCQRYEVDPPTEIAPCTVTIRHACTQGGQYPRRWGTYTHAPFLKRAGTGSKSATSGSLKRANCKTPPRLTDRRSNTGKVIAACIYNLALLSIQRKIHNKWKLPLEEKAEELCMLISAYGIKNQICTKFVDRRMSIQKMLRKRIPLHPLWN